MENKDIDLNIYAVKDDSNIGYKLKKPVHPNLPDLRRNFVLGIIAPRHSGKTTLYTNLLLNPNFFNATENCDGGVYVFSPTVMSDFTAKWLREVYSESLYPKYQDSVLKDVMTLQESYPPDERPKTMIILDDNIGTRTKYFDNLCTRSRHYNTSIIASVQAFRHLNKVARSNMSDCILGKTYNAKEMQAIYEEVGALCGSKKRFFKMWSYACNQKYHFMYMKLDSNPVRVFKNFSEEITNKFPFDTDDGITVQQGHDTNTSVDES